MKSADYMRELSQAVEDYLESDSMKRVGYLQDIQEIADSLSIKYNYESISVRESSDGIYCGDIKLA